MEDKALGIKPYFKIGALLAGLLTGVLASLIFSIMSYTALKGYERYFKYPEIPTQTMIIDKGLVELINNEEKLANYPKSLDIKDIYAFDACLTRNIYGQVSEIRGIKKIEEFYNHFPVEIIQQSKFNYKVSYTRYEGTTPTEAIISYDIFIEYKYQDQVQYEYKVGREFIKARYNLETQKWLITYFYVESM